ncbi:MAG TPA: T9SS type A sorting domain-containing protein [bacterium]|nr:T9SS type A sorting domain-containing protein [bacterium]HPN44690.1 T9SS type A sorting domain-containing protein [bacterium]
MKHKIITFLGLTLLFTGFAFAGNVTISLVGENPLTINIKGSSSNQQAGSISIYLYYCDDATTTLDISNVNDDQLETTWGWGSFLRTQNITTGSWVKGGYTFTRRLLYDNAGVSSLDDYWSTGGINALVCTFSAVGSGHAWIEVNGADGLADWAGNAHVVTYSNQEQALPVELSAFSAISVAEGALISWATESEMKNLGFILEKKNRHETDFTTIASYKTHANLAGQGTTSLHTEYSFIDTNVAAGDTCTYRLADVDREGIMTVLGTIQAIVTQGETPAGTDLLPAYPNPFNPETTVKYTLHQDALVTITVYDLLGRLVKTLVDENQTAGSYHIVWNGTNNLGAQAASGAYLVRMQTAEVTQTQKVLLLK